MGEHKILSAIVIDEMLYAEVLIEDPGGDPEENRIVHVEVPAFIYDHVDDVTMRTILRAGADKLDPKKNKAKKVKKPELEK